MTNYSTSARITNWAVMRGGLALVSFFKSTPFLWWTFLFTERTRETRVKRKMKKEQDNSVLAMQNRTFVFTNCCMFCIGKCLCLERIRRRVCKDFLVSSTESLHWLWSQDEMDSSFIIHRRHREYQNHESLLGEVLEANDICQWRVQCTTVHFLLFKQHSIAHSGTHLVSDECHHHSTVWTADKAGSEVSPSLLFGVLTCGSVGERRCVSVRTIVNTSCESKPFSVVLLLLISIRQKALMINWFHVIVKRANGETHSWSRETQDQKQEGLSELERSTVAAF